MTDIPIPTERFSAPFEINRLRSIVQTILQLKKGVPTTPTAEKNGQPVDYFTAITKSDPDIIIYHTAVCPSATGDTATITDIGYPPQAEHPEAPLQERIIRLTNKQGEAILEPVILITHENGTKNNKKQILHELLTLQTKQPITLEQERILEGTLHKINESKKKS